MLLHYVVEQPFVSAADKRRKPRALAIFHGSFVSLVYVLRSTERHRSWQIFDKHQDDWFLFTVYKFRRDFFLFRFYGRLKKHCHVYTDDEIHQNNIFYLYVRTIVFSTLTTECFSPPHSIDFDFANPLRVL